MLYGIEQSTDMRCPRTVVKKFTSKKQLLEWMKTSGNFTYADPEKARNWHRTFRYGYELHGRVDRKDSCFNNIGTSTYPRNGQDNFADYICKHGNRIKLEN